MNTILFSLVAQAGREVPPLLSFFPIFLVFLVFYLILIRPQRKQQKEREQMIQNLNKNDEVVTVGGLHGTVVGLKDKSVLLRIAENVKVEVERSAIAKVQKSRSPEQEVVEKK